VRIRSDAAAAGPTGLHRFVDRRALHRRAEHLIRRDGVHHPVEGRALLILVAFALLLPVAVRRSLRIAAHRALHARGRVDPVTRQDVIDLRQRLGEPAVVTYVR